MSGRVKSIADFYRGSDYAAFDQEHRSGGSFGVDMFAVEQQAHELIDPPVPQLLVVGCLDGTGRGELDYGEGWRRYRASPVGRCDLQPANSEARFCLSGPSSILAAALPIDALTEQLERVGVRGDPYRSLYGQFAGAIDTLGVLRGMWAAMRDGGAANDLLVDGLVIALIGRFATLAEGEQRWELPTLDDKRLRRVVDYIESAFGSPVCMTDLAKVACLSTIQFSRAFKKAVGCTPHAYLVQRRLSHARTLLSTTRLPVREVGLLCGFNSPGHFAGTFVSHVGASPSDYRKACGSGR